MKISKKELQDMIAETIASNSSVLLETPDVPIGNRDAVDGFGEWKASLQTSSHLLSTPDRGQTFR